VSRYFIKLAFKGTRYAGWQIQDNAVAVQELLNNALQTLLKQDMVTIGCGRTDTGVHARQFYVHFDSTVNLEDDFKFVHRLNSILPDDIVVYEWFKVDANAHARFDAISRTYEYFISLNKDPFLKEFAMNGYGTYEMDAMLSGTKYLIGERDYSSFSKSNTQVKTNICDIKNASWDKRGDVLVFTITANRFLRGMVRAIVGTMLEVGTGKLQPHAVADIISSGQRSNAGVTVPACGLYLTEIRYPYIKQVLTNNFPC